MHAAGNQRRTFQLIFGESYGGKQEKPLSAMLRLFKTSYH
jgi:hypothetical protein